MKKSQLKINGKNLKNAPVYIFAHGAGAPMDSDWMNEVSALIQKEKVKVIRFEFPYMEERRKSGTKRPPNTQKVLLETWRSVIDLALKDKPLKVFIGGKSMGGRMASLLIDEYKGKVDGLICLGFPFHAPGKEPKDRIAHLENLKVKALILQGERDSMGNFKEVSTYNLSKKIKVKWLKDGDHSLRPRVKSGITLEENLIRSAKEIAKFCLK